MLEIKDIRALKGAALSIVILGLLDQQPHRAEWFERMSGYTDKPISKALKYLSEISYMLKVPAGWMIATDQQLRLREKSRNNSEKIEKVGIIPRKSRNNSENLPPSSSSRYINTNNKEILDLTTTTRDQKSRNNSDFEKKLKTCFELGIKNPKASMIAEMDEITEEEIRQHVEDANGAVGLAIYRIEHGWKPKARKKAKPKLCLDCRDYYTPPEGESPYHLRCPECDERLANE